MRQHESQEPESIGGAKRHALVGVLQDIGLDELDVGHEPVRMGPRTGRPGIREDAAIQRHVVSHVHASADPHTEAAVRENVPDGFLFEPVAIPEMKDAVVGIVEPGVHGDPLDPRLEMRRSFGRFRDVDVRLVAQVGEVRQLAGFDETVQQRRGQLVEFQQQHRRGGSHRLRARRSFE